MGDFAVSKLSMLTGTIVATEASRPVPKKKSMEVTSTTNSTSTKSTRSTTLTTKDSSSPTMTGTDKSTNGALRLSLVLKKSSFANTQDTTKTQPKLKSINSMLFSENKLRSGLVFKKTNFTVKSKLSTKESRAAFLNGNCAPNKWSTRSKLTGKLACLYGKRTPQRACLEKRSRECARVHLLKFDRFFCSAFGAKPTNKLIVALREHYHCCVNEKVEKVLAKYDYFHY